MAQNDIIKAIGDKNRIKIIHLLENNESMTYTEILNEMGISTGLLNYHLKVLFPLLNKNDNRYSLNDYGKAASQLIPLMSVSYKRGNIGLPGSVAEDTFVGLFWIMLAISAGGAILLLARPGTFSMVFLLMASAITAFFLFKTDKANVNRSMFAGSLAMTALVDSAALGMYINYGPSGISVNPYLLLNFLVPALIFTLFILPFTIKSRKMVLVGIPVFLVISLFVPVAVALQATFSPASMGTCGEFYTPFPIIFYIAIIIMASFLLKGGYEFYNRRQNTK